MLDKLLIEINELKEYKKKHEYIVKDKEAMSERLFELMMEKYNNTSYEERCKFQKEDGCRCCRFNFCGKEFDKDIGIPCKSEKAWIPGRKGCGEFEWD